MGLPSPTSRIANRQTYIVAELAADAIRLVFSRYAKGGMSQNQIYERIGLFGGQVAEFEPTGHRWWEWDGTEERISAAPTGI